MMKYLLVFIIGLALITSCGSVEESSTEKIETVEEVLPEPSSEELEEKSQQLMAKVLDVKELDLQLNNGEKWELEAEVFTGLMKIKQQIYVISGNMESYEVSSYNEMGKEFLDFVSNIPVTKNESANIELQKVISATKEQCLHMLGSDLQSSQISVINLSNIFDEVPGFFVVEN